MATAADSGGGGSNNLRQDWLSDLCVVNVSVSKRSNMSLVFV